MTIRVVISFLFLLAACKSKTVITAKQYSDEVLQMQQNLAEPIRQAEIEIKAFGDSSNFTGMAGAAGKMETLIQGKIDTLNKVDITAFKGGDEFKVVVIRYFEYLKSVYSSYKEIGNAANTADKIKATNEMYQKLAAQQDVEDRMRTSQTRFAALNGFLFTETDPSAAPPDTSLNR